ncbi:hypothetical protein M404DRAFT_293908 [Pisolithus tinctorius Marx 270]|uniref:Arrestin C-terminal-like domain-containing protein n=1 Tax=Pisolithus tinctorius Marx 270 TaxID=870435 RepID=A0A0C3IFW5_PISTI|nr:hypothetical protein M404DRAFT_293908 [Pisolithus tinctorius Marx 270]
MAEAGKNALSIRLTEPFIFLRTNDPSGLHPPDPADSPGLVRGLVTLNLAKPTRISSIEVELQAVVTATWPEGIGPRRLDVTNDNTVYSAKTTCFRADDLSFARRAASVGPGLFLSNANDYDQEFHPRPPTYTPSASASAQQTQPMRSARHGSCDFVTRNREPTPRYTSTPSADSSFVLPSATTSSSHVGQPGVPTTLSSASLSSGADQHDLTTSRRPSSEEAYPLPRLSPIPTGVSRSPERGRRVNSPHSHDTSARCESVTRTSRGRSRFSLSSVLDVVKEVTGTVGRSKSRSARFDSNGCPEETERGRTKVRAAVPPTTLDVDTTPHPSTSQQPRQTSHPHSYSFFGLGRVLGLDGDAEDDAGRGRKHKDHGEGWKEFREGTYTYPIVFPLSPHLPPTYKLPWASLSYTLRAVVHRPGAFTSKMTCSKPFIVVSAPAVSTSEGGGASGDPGPVSIDRVWEGRLGYSIELPGRLLIAGAGDEVTHPANDHGGGNVGGSRINLNGAAQGDRADLVSLRTFNSMEAPQARIPAEGTIVLGLTLVPLEKVKVWRIAAFIDERVTYLSNGTASGRDDTLHRVVLWSVEDTQSSHDNEGNSMDAPISGKAKGKETAKAPEPIPILPTPLSPHRSPLLPYLRPGADPSDLIGPGPYNFSTVLSIPGCGNAPSKGPLITFSIRHRDAGVRVEHTLRIVVRVERVDENHDSTSDSVGEDSKKQLFDIAVQVPVVVLSCRALEWQTLPRYCEVLDDNAARAPESCPCAARVRGGVVGERQPEQPYTISSDASSFENGSVLTTSTDTHLPSMASSSGSGLASPLPGSLLHAPTPPDMHPANAIVHQQSPNQAVRPESMLTVPRDAAHPSHIAHLHLRPTHSHSRSPAREPLPTITRYERLVSGQESEAGEAPPSYESVAGSVSLNA